MTDQRLPPRALTWWSILLAIQRISCEHGQDFLVAQQQQRLLCLFFMSVTLSGKTELPPTLLHQMVCGLRVNVFGRSSWSLFSVFFSWLFY